MTYQRRCRFMSEIKSQWNASQQEYRTEKFWGGDHFDLAMEAHHPGYLSFGYWHRESDGCPISDNVEACENLYLALGNRVGLDAESVVLDVACSMLQESIYLHRTFGSTITGLDCVNKHIEVGRIRVANANLEQHIAPVYGSGENIPLDSGSFTHVFCVEGTPYMDRSKFFKESHRVLNANGRIAIGECMVRPSSGFLFEKLAAFVADAWQIRRENIGMSEQQYRFLLSDAGFRDIQIEYIGKHVYTPFFINDFKELGRMIKVRGWHAIAKVFHNLLCDLSFRFGWLEYAFVTAGK